ncbi:S-adenosyl-methyltransferase MraW [Catonella morbi ATCC 51271]|uniref:Ribosomal RNA small subunit methyltransferase H n=1 Tax=Catonella morbi ATCC 51271 TaxID=592026 RepID=V2XIR5_9FIRM|nr:S-adenosyl-methyltransferase MraW [Catonella morbi ATCC 51271]
MFMSENIEFKHIPIMLEEVIEGLDIKPNGIYVDGTLGGGGHSYEIAKRLVSGGRLIGIDQDEAAIKAAGARLSEFGDRVIIVRSNYAQMVSVLQSLGIEQVDGILLDLGVSSHQLDNAERGFSYMEDALLDMRMDRRQEKTARDIVNYYSQAELTRIIRDYGEDRFAAKIVAKIIDFRENKPVETTGELAEIIKSAIPVKYRLTGGHPAKRTFQAIRIELNRELGVLEESIEGMLDILSDGGRMAVIAFHSLEDRIVKSAFKKAESPCTCPPDFPICVCGKKSKGFVASRKPLIPSDEETERNPRAKSSKLRIFVRKREENE